MPKPTDSTLPSSKKFAEETFKSITSTTVMLDEKDSLETICLLMCLQLRELDNISYKLKLLLDRKG